MDHATPFDVRRCAVAPEPLLDGATPDYADSFELLLSWPDQHSAKEWIGGMLRTASPAVMALVAFVHGRVARFRLGPPDGDHLRGWRLTRCDDEVVMLETAGPLLRAVIVGRRTAPERLTFTTFLFYNRAAATKVLWFIIRPLHQRVARYLLENAARVMVNKIPVETAPLDSMSGPQEANAPAHAYGGRDSRS